MGEEKTVMELTSEYLVILTVVLLQLCDSADGVQEG